jgi:hypothetical protein
MKYAIREAWEALTVVLAVTREIPFRITGFVYFVISCMKCVIGEAWEAF